MFKMPVFLAPMEGVTDSVFRKICKEMGADIAISEFISSDALIRNVENSIAKMNFSSTERPFGIQIFGGDEMTLCKAAEIASMQNPDFIDINCGCPVKKIVSKGAGSALLKNIPKMIALAKAIVNMVDIPVTVKTRLGWDDSDKPIENIVQRLQDVGVQGVTIHGRTRSQMYTGEADWNLIKKIKENINICIPVIGNGDINSGEKAIEYYNNFKVDGIMVGRAAIGNPWIFKDIKNIITGNLYYKPDYKERVDVCLKHLQESSKIKGEKRAILEMRAHYNGYFRSIPDFKKKKIALMQALNIEECRKILLDF